MFSHDILVIQWNVVFWLIAFALWDNMFVFDVVILTQMRSFSGILFTSELESFEDTCIWDFCGCFVLERLQCCRMTMIILYKVSLKRILFIRICSIVLMRIPLTTCTYCLSLQGSLQGAKLRILEMLCSILVGLKSQRNCHLTSCHLLFQLVQIS